MTFFTLAVAIQLDQHWVTIAWATEALMLTWVGLRSATSAPRHAALVVFAVALAHWAGVDLSDSAADAGGMFMPLLNRRSASGAALVASCAAAAWLYRRDAEKVEERERTMIVALLTLTANALALTFLSLDVNEYFERRISQLAEGQTGVSGEADRLRNSKQFAFTFVWTIYAVAAIAFGVVRRANWCGCPGCSLLAVALSSSRARRLYSAAWWHAPVFNQTFAAFALVVGRSAPSSGCTRGGASVLMSVSGRSSCRASSSPPICSPSSASAPRRGATLKRALTGRPSPPSPPRGGWIYDSRSSLRSQ